MSPAPRRLLVASLNPGKARELVRLLAPIGVEVLTPADLGIREAYEETGATYEENARGKAVHYAALAGLTAVADDSGIEVDALGGRPGPLSARYGGPGLDDAGRVRLLLRELAGVPEERRTARYVAVAAVARPGAAAPSRPGAGGGAAGRKEGTGGGDVRLFRAVCEGRIALEARGSRGFGYDPVFFYPPYGATFGEIEEARKDRVSHRGLALARVAEFLASPEGTGFLSPGG